MHCRMVAPPDVEREAERLYDIWSALPESESGDWFDYLEANCSEAVKAYMRECDEIRSRLEPGEYV